MCWDTVIEKTQRLIAAKECFLACQRQRLFLFGGAVDWMPVRLSEVLVEHKILSDGTAPVYSVSVHKGLIDQVEHLGRSFAAKDTHRYNLVRPGDIVYTKSPTGEFPYGILKQSHATRNAIVSPLYSVFTPSNPDTGLLIDFFFESPIQARNYLRPLIQKGAKNTISIDNEDFLSGIVRLPRTEIAARKAATLVRDARKEISILRAISEKYRRQKFGLMQKLLAGKWHVPLSETQVA